MRVTYPDYYQAFRCIGPACQDNCCIGWEIDIDPISAARYQSPCGQLEAKFKDGIQWEDPPHFKLKEQERCYFLNERNLCDIQCALGEEGLCEICSQHPRFHEWFGDYKESGLGLCCEAVGRLIFAQEHPISFVQVSTSEIPDDDGPEKHLFQTISHIRSTAFSIVQDRNLSLRTRLCLLIELAHTYQTCLDQQDEDGLEQLLDLYCSKEYRQKMEGWYRSIPCSASEETWRGMLHLLKEQNPLDESWPQDMERLEEELPNLLSQAHAFWCHMADREYEMEHLAVYFLYRYLLKAAYDGDVLSKIGFAVVGCLAIRLMGLKRWQDTRQFSIIDQIELAKNYSKQVEYDADNVIELMEAIWAEDWADPRHLMSMVAGLFPAERKKDAGR